MVKIEFTDFELDEYAILMAVGKGLPYLPEETIFIEMDQMKYMEKGREVKRWLWQNCRGWISDFSYGAYHVYAFQSKYDAGKFRLMWS